MKKLLYSLGFALFLSAFIIFPDTANYAVKNALYNISAKMIPSIFPLMVISDMIASVFYRKNNNYFIRNAFFVFVVSNLCGFPVGSKLAANLKHDGIFNEKEAIACAVFSNNASPAYVISFVGISLFHNKLVGIVLYLIQLICSVFSACLFYLYNKKHFMKKYCKLNYRSTGGSDFYGVFRGAVTNAAVASLYVSAFIAVFSVIIDYISAMFSYFNVHAGITGMISAALELSRGCIDGSKLAFPFSIFICSFSIGFTGLSVILQSVLFLKKENINVKPFIIHKILQGVLSALINTVIFSVFPYISVPAFNVCDAMPLSINMSLLSLIIIFTYLIFNIRQICLIKHKSRKKA